jgi:acyl-CoA thioesterase FadM
MREQRIGFPTVNVQAEFFAPMVYGDEIEIEVKVTRVGDSSATFVYAARRASDATLCARSEQVHVAMNLDTRRPVRVPPDLRRAFGENAV